MAIKTDTYSSAGGGAGSDTLDDVTARGATTTNAITVGGVSVGTEYSLPTVDGSANQVLQTNGTGTLSFATLDFTGGLEYKGAFNATAGTPSLLNAEKGDFYIIDTAGTIYGQTWAVGDHLLINADMGGTITNSKIDKIDNTQAVTSVNTQTGAVVLSGNDLLADHTAVNYTAANNNIDGHLSGIDSALGAVASPTLDDVTTNGDTTTNAINVGTITTSGDILADSDASRTIGAEATRFITYHGDMNGAIRFKAKNNQGTAISKGQVVYISGVSGTVPEVKLAKADSALTMPAFGLALENANNLAEVQIITFGNLTDYNTTTYSLSANDTVFVSATTAGALVNSAPTGEGNLIQNIGRVVRADASAGIIKVGGAGRSAATPNLDQDKIFLGNASNQSVSTALNTIGLSKFNNDSGFLTDITSESLNDLSDVSFTAGAGIDNYVLTYDNATTSWGAEAAPTASAASETVAGVIEIATNAEATAGTATDKALVPSNISSLDLSAMDNTTSAFISDITSESLNDLSDVSFTAGAGIDNYVLTYDHSTTSWGAEAASGGGYTTSFVGSSNFNATDNTFYFVNTASGTTTTATLPDRGSDTSLEYRFKFFNHGDGLLRILELNNPGLIDPSEDGSNPGDSGSSMKYFNSRCLVEVYSIVGTSHYEWVVSDQLEMGKESLSTAGQVLRYNPTNDQMTALPYTFPTSDGSANQILKTDGAGALSFIDQPSGGGGYTYSAITADPANAQYDYHYSCTGTFTITLPASASGDAGKEIRIKNMGTGTITIDGNASETIDNQTTIDLDVQYSSITLVATGNTPAAWEIV